MYLSCLSHLSILRGIQRGDTAMLLAARYGYPAILAIAVELKHEYTPEMAELLRQAPVREQDWEGWLIDSLIG